MTPKLPESNYGLNNRTNLESKGVKGRVRNGTTVLTKSLQGYFFLFVRVASFHIHIRIMNGKELKNCFDVF